MSLTEVPVAKHKVINGYLWGEELGRGTWGKVRRVRHLATDEECAVKIVYRTTLTRKIRNGVQLFYDEFALVRTLDHPNIIRYRELDDTSNPDKFYLFMELCAGPISTLAPTADRCRLLRDKFRQLLCGLAYLHGQRIAHHDIKTENILVATDGTVKISDFGVAERHGAEGCRVFFGTPAFQAPEIVGNVSGDPFDGAKADVWSAGVVLYQLVVGRLPFQGASVYLTMKAIDEDAVKIPPLADRKLSDLLARLLTKDPTRRPSASIALTHPWFSPTEDATSEDAQCCTIL